MAPANPQTNASEWFTTASVPGTFAANIHDSSAVEYAATASAADAYASLVKDGLDFNIEVLTLGQSGAAMVPFCDQPALNLPSVVHFTGESRKVHLYFGSLVQVVRKLKIAPKWMVTVVRGSELVPLSTRY
ncbi:Protein of unknown function [Gryllus bimaculatus]|nr:Protein of unknown function [Gryllus bimaculatus]